MLNDIPPEHALADYVASLTYEAINAKARARLADIVLDTIAVGIGAHVSRQASGMIVEDLGFANGMFGAKGVASLWSGRGRGPADIVAACNGTCAEVLDYQDTVVDPRNNGHAAVTIVPAALAVAERQRTSGAKLLTAVGAGLEVTIAILRCVGRAHRADGRGFRTTSLAAPLGAAVACAKLLDLDKRGILNAMGLAGACAPNGLMPSLSPANGTFGMDKDWVNGLAAQLAVNSADLAARGMTASDRVVTGDRGIAASHAHGDGRPLVAPAGGSPNLQAIALKRFAACYGVHTAMEAAASLLAENNLAPDNVEAVTVRVKSDSATTLAGRTISNHMAARFSLPFAVASAITRPGSASMHDFDEPAISDPRVLAYMDRISIVPDAVLTGFHEKTGGFPAIVEVRANNETYSRRIDYPLGSDERPMTSADLAAKFRELTEGHWPGDQAMMIFDRLRAIGSEPDVGNVLGLLGAGQQANGD